MKNPFCVNDEVCIDGAFYKVHTDFRTWIGYERIMASDLSFTEKCVKAVVLCFKEPPPKLDSAVEALMEFYLAGDERKSMGGNAKPLFNFEKDFGYIYASFMSEYGIDLFDSDIHWHKFLHLLKSLGEECIFKKVISYRGVDLSKIKDKDKKAYLRRMKHLYALDTDADADISDAF